MNLDPLFNALIVLHFILAPSTAVADSITPLQYSTTTAPVIIEAYAIHYAIPSKPLIDTLRCESGFNSRAVGDFGTSFGLAQIHLPAHADITKEEALNPYFAIDFAARSFAEGKQGMWSCYRSLYGKNAP